MNTRENVKEAKLDQAIENADGPMDVAEPKKHTKSIYWWLRQELGYSHTAAVVATHAAVTNDPDWSICFRALKTLEEASAERYAFEEKKAEFEEFARSLEKTQDHLNDVGDGPDDDIMSLLSVLNGRRS